MPSAGQAWIDIVPSMRGWHAEVRRQLARELAGINVKVPIEPDVEGVKRSATRAGETAGGHFAQSFKRRVEAALKALPDVKIGADSTEAQREIADIRRELLTLSEKTVGVDIDAGEANARIAQLRARLDQLAAQNPTIDLDVDIAAASAQLAQIDRQADRLDGRNVEVQVDVDRGGAAFGSLDRLERQALGVASAGYLIGPALVSGLGAASFAAAGLASALAAAGAGVGALVAASIPAFSAVSDAVKATDQAEKAAATSAITSTRQRVGAAYQAQQAAERVGEAQRQADRTAIEGAEQVADAQQALADTRVDVAERIEDASERVTDAEKDLERAHDDVRRAQEELTEARREAVRVLEDLREKSSDLVLSEESAEIALIEARQALAETNADATATLLDRRKAALRVAEAEDRLSDVQRDQRRTSEELRDAERAGINGSDLVVAANERLSDASLAVIDAREGVAEAQRDLVKAERDGARQIAEAEERVADARQDAAEANADAARAVGDALEAQAQQAEMANLQAQNGIAANRNLAYALGELTPMQRQLYDGWIRLRDAFKAWAESLEPAVIPVFLAGMGLIEQMLPMLTPLVLASADAFRNLLDRASTALESPFWQEFFDFLARTAGPAIEGFGTVVGNLAWGFAALLMAFEPMAHRVTRGLVDLSERFREWATSIDTRTVEGMWSGIADSVGRFADGLARVWEEGLRPLLNSQEFRDFYAAFEDFRSRVWDELIDVMVIFLRDVAPPLLEFTARFLEFMIWVDDHTGGVLAAMFGIATALSAIAAIPVLGPLITGFGTALAGLIGAGPLAVVVALLGELFLWVGFVQDQWGKWPSIIPLFTGPVGIAGFIIGGVIRNLQWFKDTIVDIFNWVRDNWYLLPLFLVSPIAGAVILIRTHWDTITGIFQSAWNFIRDYIFNPIRNFLRDKLGPAFTTAKDAIIGAFNTVKDTIGGIWTSITTKVKNGINTAIGFLNTLFAAIDSVAEEIGWNFNFRITPIGGSPPTQRTGAQEHQAQRRATGGFLTNGPQFLVGEGNPAYPEAVIATDPQYRRRNLGLWTWAGHELGVPGFARGGIPSPPPGVGDAISGFTSNIPGAGIIGLGGEAIDIAQRLANALRGMVDGPFGLMKRLATSMKDKAVDFLKDKVGSFFSGSGNWAGVGVERWRETALQALRMTGSPLSWINSLLRRMNQESGGNPNAINLWDSNAMRGDPSMGLMQNIGSAYPSRIAGFPSLRGTTPFHPLGSIVASIVYANQRYGKAPIGWDRPGGYAMGGILPAASVPFLGSFATGLDRVPHDGLLFAHRDEAVLDPTDAAMWRDAANGSVKANRSYEQTLNFNGLTDPHEIARMASDEMAWRIRVG